MANLRDEPRHSKSAAEGMRPTGPNCIMRGNLTLLRAAPNWAHRAEFWYALTGPKELFIKCARSISGALFYGCVTNP